MTPSKQNAILELIDDPNPIVRKELLNELTRQGPHGIDFLNRLRKGVNRLHIWHANRLIGELQQTDPTSMLRSFIDSQNYELETGCFYIAKVAYPELNITEFCQSIDDIAKRCRELCVEPSNAKDRCIVINRVLFHELGYRGNLENYEDPSNSFLNNVIATRKGIPISLSCLYILVGQRLGLELEGIGLPGHFMVASFADKHPIYVDPFERGRFWTAPQLMERLESKNYISSVHVLAPVSVREILCRSCRNLVSHFALVGQNYNSQLFNSFVNEFEEAFHKQHHPH